MKIETYEAMSTEGEKYGVFLTPTVMVGEKVVGAGRGISEKEIEKYVRYLLEKADPA